MSDNRSWRVTALAVIGRREIRAHLQSGWLYTIGVLSLLTGGFLAGSYVDYVLAAGVLVAASPLYAPLLVVTIFATACTGLWAATTVAYDQERGTVSVLLSGPVDAIGYLAGKLGGLWLAYGLLIGIDYVYLWGTARVTGFALPAGYGWFFLLLAGIGAATIALGLWLSCLTGRVRNAVLLYAGLLIVWAGLAVVPLLASAGLVSMVAPVRQALLLSSAALDWLSPFTYLGRGLEGLAAGDISGAALNLVGVVVYAVVAWGLAVVTLNKRGSGAPMNRWMAALVVALVLGLGLDPQALQADAPVKDPGLVYRLNVFNGRAHVYTYSPVKDETIYALAGAPLVLNPRSTLVYYWPTTQRHMADWETRDEPATGTLEVVQDGRVLTATQATPYALTRRRQDSSEANVSTGAAAAAAYDAYQQSLSAYWAAAGEYQMRVVEYERALSEYTKLTGEGKPATAPVAPTPAATPNSYTTAPDMGYVVTLPVGQYALRLRGADGRVVSGSERGLEVFTHRRTGVALTILPESRWTVSERSAAPDEAIYAAPGSTLYLEPWLALEYPAEAYQRLLDPEDTETVRGWNWVDVLALDQARLRLQSESGASAEITLKPYYVQQTAAASRGYNIVEYDAGRFPGEAASFTAFKLAADASGALEVTGDARLPASGTGRALRLVRFSNTWTLYLPALGILIAAAGILYRAHKSNS